MSSLFHNYRHSADHPEFSGGLCEGGVRAGAGSQVDLGVRLNKSPPCGQAQLLGPQGQVRAVLDQQPEGRLGGLLPLAGGQPQVQEAQGGRPQLLLHSDRLHHEGQGTLPIAQK